MASSPEVPAAGSAPGSESSTAGSGSAARAAEPASSAAGSSPRGDEPPLARRVRSLRAGRSYLLIAVVAVLGLWLVLVFGRALSELNAATERAAELRAESAALEARLEAGRRELELVRSDAFQRLQARAYGLGDEGERPFALEPDAPPPPTIVPLGADSSPARRTPLDAWLQLLFGGP